MTIPIGNGLYSFKDAVSFLFSLSTVGIKLGLETISTLLTDMGNPQKKIKSVLVAGTNGKGSVCALLAEILSRSRFKVGLSTSPHLVTVTERIRINGRQIKEEKFAELIFSIKQRADALYTGGELSQYPTYFEFITAAAFVWFADEQVDVAVMEIGLGGRFDAVNVTDPLLSIITGIDLDHQKHLGKTLSQIAREKGGVMRRDGDVVINVRHPRPKELLKQMAIDLHAKVHNVSEKIAVKERKRSPLNTSMKNGTRRKMEKVTYSFSFATDSVVYRDVVPSLPGLHQGANVATAIVAAELIMEKGIKIDSNNVIPAVESCQWPARLEWCNWKIPILFDGAHNPAGIRMLTRYLKECMPSRKFDLFFASKVTKNYKAMTEKIFPLARKIYLLDRNDMGFVPPSTICRYAQDYQEKIVAYDSFDIFFHSFKPELGVDFLLVTGSLYLAGAVKAFLGRPSITLPDER